MRGVLLFLTAAMCLSCSTFRKKPEGEVSSSVNVTPSVKAALDSTYFVTGNWPDPEWWKEYGDEQLDYIIDVALKESPTIVGAHRKVMAATASAKSTASAFYPKMYAHFQELYAHLSDESLFRIPPSTVSAVINQIDLGLFVNYEFDFWGKNAAKYRAALGAAYAKKAEAALTQITLATTITSAYIHLQFLQDRKDKIIEAYDATKEIFDLRQLRMANGLDDQFNLDDVEENVLALEQMLIAVEASINITTMQLKVLMGRSPDDEFTFKKPAMKDISHFPIPNKLSLDLLARRADLMASLWNVQAKMHLTKAARAAYFPSINLAAYGGIESLAWHTLFSAKSLTGFLFPSINLPLFTGFKLGADLEKSHQDFSVAVYEYNEKVLQAAQEVTSNLTMLRSDYEKRGVRLRHVEKKRSQYKLEDLRYETGVAKKLDVLQRKIALIEDTLTLLDVEEEYYHGMVDLVKALGGGYGRE